MSAIARKLAESIGHYLASDDPFAVSHLSRNIRAMIAEPLDKVEHTQDVIATAHAVEHEVQLYLEQVAGFAGIPDRGPGSEAQRRRAIQAAKRFEDAVGDAPSSKKAKILGL